MAEEMGGVQPASNGLASASTVAEPTDIERARRMAEYRKKQAEAARRALNRHIGRWRAA
jgi:hypothetical protein